MELNLQSTLLSKNKSNFFSTKVRNNLDVAMHFKGKIGRMIRTNSINIIKSFYVTQILLRKEEIIIGDKGGFVLSINEKGMSHDLYKHQMEITALIQNEADNILISGSKDEIIKIYNFTHIEDPIELIGMKEPIISLELNKVLNRLFSGGNSGKIFVWDINTHEQISIIETKLSNVNCLQFSDQLFKLAIGQINGIINIVDFQQNKQKIKTVKSQQSDTMSCMCISQKGKTLYVGSKEGYVDVIDLKQDIIIKTIEVTSQLITSINLFHDDYFLLVTDYKGRITMQETQGNSKSELRNICKEGYSKAVINNTQQYFYVIGIKDTIEKWDLKKERLLNRFQRNETPNLENYHSFFNDFENDRFYACTQESNLMAYKIDDNIQKTHIIDRTAYPLEWQIFKVGSLSEQSIIYFCCQDFTIRICSASEHKLLAKLTEHNNLPVQLLYQSQNNQLISIDEIGYVYIWDAKSFQLKKKYQKAQPCNIIFGFLSESEKSLFTLREDGFLNLMKLSDGHIHSQKTLNDEKITAFTYNKKINQLLTGDAGGIIMQTNIRQESKIKFKELVDMIGEIKAIAQDSEGKLMAFATEELQIYIYSLEKEFNYDKLCSVYFEINHLFFSPNHNLLYACGPQGNLTSWDIKPKIHLRHFQKLNKQHVYSMACNGWYIFLGLEDCLEVFDVESQDRLSSITEDYTRAYKLVMSFDGATLYGSHENGGISLWDVENFRRLVILVPYDNQIVDFCISEKDYFLGIYYQNNHTVIYDLFNQKIYSQFTTLREMRTIKIIGEDHYLATELQTGEVGIYTLKGMINCFVGKKSNFLKGYVETFDYNYLCLIYRDATIQVWDVRKGEHIQSYEKRDLVINDFCISEDKSNLYIISSRGHLLYMNMKTGQYYQEIDLDNHKKTSFMQRYSKTIFFLNDDDEICQIQMNKTLSFFQKQYIKKAFVTYGRASSEKQFLKFFQVIKEEFDQSMYLQNYFNPYFSCALFNYQRALQQIQEQKLAHYPILNSQNQISPLVLAIKLEHLNLAQIILIELSKNPQDVLFSNDEMRTLLNSRYEFTQKYMQYFFVHIKRFTGTNLKVPLLSRLEEPLRINRDYKHHFTTEKFNELTRVNKQIENLPQQDQEILLKKVKNKLLGADAKSEVSSNTDNTSNYTYYDTNNSKNDEKMKNKKKIAMWIPTNFYRINGIYNFQQGQKESLEFLENYTDSKSNEFILSNWKIIIDYKWEQIFFWLIPLSIINWAHCIFYFQLMIFPDKMVLLIFDYTFLLIIFVYELISMIVSGPLQYITSLNNIFDMIILVLCCVLNYYTYTLEGLKGESDHQWLSALQVFSLIVVYYRALTYLRIFKLFRNVIDMLVGVAKSSVSLLIIVALIVLALSIIFVKSTSGNNSLGHFLMNTVNSVLGEITFETGDFGVLPWIVLVFTCIFLPVILINFLIAKISNKYTELEELEEVTSYREKAELIAEIEYFYLLRNRSKNIMRDWESTFFDTDTTEGFTFFAMNSQYQESQEEEQESQLQDKFEQFENTINNLHKSYLEDKQLIEHRKDLLSSMLENFNQEFQELKGQLVMIRSDTGQQNDEQNEKLKILKKSVETFQKLVEDQKNYDLSLQENIQKSKRSFW